MHAVSAQRIQQTIEKLVSFQARHTLSSDVSASSGKGINAAADWIKSEFESYSKACGGCLEVKTDEFVQEPGPRISQPTKLTNVYAVLRGSDPANAGRIVLVTGHYDSRNSETNDAVGASPGANDDASGTAVSMECARVLSQLKFPATIIFLTVAGEEQGLYGSAHFAKMALAQGWNIEAVFNNDIVGGDRTPGADTQDWHVVRVFSEGIPANASENEIKQIRALGGESDSTSRELARYIDSVSREYLPAKQFARCWCSAAIAICAAATNRRSISRVLRRSASPSIAKITTISTRTFALKMVLNMVTCRSSWTTTTWPTWRA